MTTRLATVIALPDRGFAVEATVYWPHPRTFEDVRVYERTRAKAEARAKGLNEMVFGVAEAENERFDRVRAYLAERAARPVTAPAQGSLF